MEAKPTLASNDQQLHRRNSNLICEDLTHVNARTSLVVLVHCAVEQMRAPEQHDMLLGDVDAKTLLPIFELTGDGGPYLTKYAF